jgi:flagellar basal body-associated protein FliL
MATQKKTQQSARQSPNNRSSANDYYIPLPPVMVNQTNDNGQIVFLISLIAVMLILPLFLYLMASMYFDMLVVQQENKQQQAIIRRLIIELENKK